MKTFLSPSLCYSLQCDSISVLEKEHDYREEHFDFIQSNVRRFCLQCILFMHICLEQWSLDLHLMFKHKPAIRQFDMDHVILVIINQSVSLRCCLD